MNGIDALRAQLRGTVLAPGDAGFIDACTGFNLARHHDPEIVVTANDAADLGRAVRYATENDLSVGVQATGHGIGTPARGGMLIDTARLRQLSIDGRQCRAIAAAGVRWHEVIDAAAPYGLAPLNGSSPAVGVVGYLLGGGIGPMGRTFGFAADHVRRIDLVTTSGRVVDIDNVSEPELFWALRGGKCEIGIVSEIEFDLMPVSSYYGGGIYFDGAHASQLLHTFGPWTGSLPESATASIALTRLPDLEIIPVPLRGRLSVHLRFVHVGDANHGAQLLEPMRSIAAPLIDRIAQHPYTAIGTVHQDPTEPLPVRDDSILLRELPPAAIDAILDEAGPGTNTALMIVELRHLGGALARQPEPPNAVGGRDAEYSIVTIGAYPPPLRDGVDAAAQRVLAAVQPWSTGGTQINLQGFATSPEQVRRAWPTATVTRLESIKRAWDPDRRFRFAYSSGTPASRANT